MAERVARSRPPKSERPGRGGRREAAAPSSRGSGAGRGHCEVAAPSSCGSGAGRGRRPFALRPSAGGLTWARSD